MYQVCFILKSILLAGISLKAKIILSYDGSKFFGSATQPHKNTVQDALARALKAFGIDEIPLFASRTDKGVHALNAVACVRLRDYIFDLAYFRDRLNFYLYPSAYIKKIELVNDDFEVRFHAKKREYIYIFNHSNFNPFLSSYHLFYPKINLSDANELLSFFIGKNDFKFFQKQGKEDTIRTMFKAYAYSYKNYTIFKFQADGFLRGQIRLTVNAVLSVLEGKIDKDDLLKQIKGEKVFVRKPSEACGLYLNRIWY